MHSVKAGSSTSKKSWSRPLSYWLLGVLVVGFVAGVFLSRGNPVTKVDLNDSGIWLTRSDTYELGRLNSELRLVDAKLTVASPLFDVLQSGSNVMLVSPDSLLSIDVRIPQTRGRVELPVGATVEMGGGTAAVFDPSGGVLWAGDPLTVGTSEFSEVPPTAELEGVDRVMVGVDGSVFTIRFSSGVVSSIDAEGIEREIATLGAVSSQATVTLVGRRAVILDGSRLVSESLEVDLADFGEEFLLQEPSRDWSGVVLASETGLLWIDLKSGSVEEMAVGAKGGAVTPVVVGGCAYGAWTKYPTVVQVCGDSRGAELEELPGVFPNSAMVFRVNRDRVALNVLPNGDAFLITDGKPVLVNDWTQALSEETQEPVDNAAETTDEIETFQPECDRGPNLAPVAVDDPDLATRQGRPVVIYPLSNDSDPNCDVLTVVLGEVDSSVGSFDLIDGGRAIQYSPNPDQTNPVSIPYSAFDGVVSSLASITISIRPDGDEGSPPVAIDDFSFVTQGKSITHNVLKNDRDPDGDAIAVQSMGDPDRGGFARFRPDGQVVYTAPGDLTGPVRIPYVVVDEMGLTDEGLLTVQVNPAATNTLPVARSDFAVGHVGDTVSVPVLANDTDADGDRLIVVGIVPEQGVTINHDTGVVSFSSDKAGVFKFVYRVSDGRSPDPVEGSLRIDIAERDAKYPPIAVRDDVVVVPGIPQIVEVLANDFDPDGDVLVVRSVQGVPRELTVEILEKSRLRINADSGAGEQTYSFRYEVSDGSGSATGLVVVRPVMTGGDNQVPVLTADSARVHAGGVISIPVLDNDYDPDGDALILDSVEIRQGDGVLIVQNDRLRFLAPRDFSGTVIGTYTVFDGFNRVSETVKILVMEGHAESNLAPDPPDIDVRTLAGREIRIVLPMDRMDPDGDPVDLLGIGTDQSELPLLGQVMKVDAGSIVYRPFDSPSAVGTDSFTYRVRDSYGAEGSGRIRVGIVPLPEVNGSPVANDDFYEVLPGATVVLPVLENDSDPEEDPIVVASEGFTPPAQGEAAVTEDGGAIELKAPSSETRLVFGYSVVDPGGARDSAVVEVVITADAGNKAPMAFDDLLAPVPVGSDVVVDVLANDVDLDGDVYSLTLEVSGIPDAIIGDDGTVSFVMPSYSVNGFYTITDPIDPSLSSTALIQVPLAVNRPPVVESLVLDVPYNETQKINLRRLISDPDGDDVEILPKSFVIAQGSGAVSLDGDTAVFDPDDRYSGPGGFTFQVTDGELTTVGAVIVNIEPSGNQTPQFRTLEAEVPAAGQRTYRLEPSVIDPDDRSHMFVDLDRSELPDSIGVSLSRDGTLELTSKDATSKGTRGVVTFVVDDGKEFGMTDGRVTITVIASDKPLPQARSDTPETNPVLGNLKQGQKNVVLDVLANDFDPFQDGTLTILRFGPVVPAGAGTVVANEANNRLMFTPSEDFHGTVTIGYTIQDKTKDLDRISSATVTLNVKGKPDAPGVPVGTPESRQVTVQWPVPNANGAPITAYEVVDNATSSVVCKSASNSCTVTGLTNGTDYRFRVRAINEVGASPLSEPSAGVRPNEAPGTPAAPITKYGDKLMTVSWSAPANEGSAILEYDVRILPTGTIQTVGANTRELVWTNLVNGTPYAFEVRARNMDFSSEWSEASAYDIPVGVPINVAAPNPPQGGDQTVTVTWDEPNTNGAPIEAYELRVFRESSLISTVAITNPGARTYTLTGAQNGARYSFEVRARNKAGWSAMSARSVVAIPSGIPFGITSLSSSIGGSSGSVYLSWGVPNNNGSAITRYEVAYSTGSNPTSFRSLSGHTVTGLTNGTRYYFRVRACNANGCATALSPVTSTIPCGPPELYATFYMYNLGNGAWFWSVEDDGSRAVDRYRITGYVNKETTDTSLAVSLNKPGTYTYVFNVSGHNSCPVNDGWGPAASYNVEFTNTTTTTRPAAPRLTLSLGAHTTLVPYPSAYYLNISGSGFPRSSAMTVTLVTSGSVGVTTKKVFVTTNSIGNFSSGSVKIGGTSGTVYATALGSKSNVLIYRMTQ